MKKILLSLVFCGFVSLIGCAVVTVKVDLDNPYLVTLAWNGEELVAVPETEELPEQTLGPSGALVSATVKDEDDCLIVPDRYDWYLDGKAFVQKGKQIYIENDLGAGTYQLSLIATKDTVLSSAQVSFIVPE